MALYTYRALTPQGRPERGTLNAPSEKEAKAMLKARQVFPLELTISASGGPSLSSLFSPRREPRFSVQQLAAFTRQFATLLEATIPYDNSLDMILAQTREINFKSALSEIKGKVVEGSYLADAMAPFPRMFPAMVVSMVRSGEASGTLTMIMHRLADYYENAARLRAKLTSAMVYPMFMVAFSSAVVIFMITYVIPKITALFTNFGVRLPLSTRILIATSDFLVNFWWLLLMLIGAGLLAGRQYLRTPAGQAAWDALELHVPLWKGLRAKMIVQRFAQTLATMLKSGIELKDALAVSAKVMENKVYLDAMDRVIFDVQNKGLPLAVALRQSRMFPEDICQMIAIGEETATLDTMLDNVSNRLSREVSASMDGAAALLEPVMILVMGAVVGFIVVSILLPMLQLNQLVH